MILNNKVSQRLEIIGFKGAVKKSTSRIQGSGEWTSRNQIRLRDFCRLRKIPLIGIDNVGECLHSRCKSKITLLLIKV